MPNIPVVHLELLELWRRVAELQNTSLKTVSTDYNITGSGVGGDPVILKDDISLSSITASNGFYGNVILSSGNGITFDNGTGSGTDSQTLSDYEVGTWTPNLRWSDGNYNLDAGSSGRYTVIGDMAFVSCYMTITGSSSIPSSADIYTVLPFQPSGFNPPWTGVIGFRNNIIGAANPNVVKTVVGTTNLIYGNNTTASVNTTNIGINTVLGFTISYKKQ